jgi:hypothetical protein
MNEKEIRKYTKELVEKGYFYEDMVEMLKEKKYSKVETAKILKIYWEEFQEAENMQISFLQKIKLKMHIKKLRKLLDAVSKNTSKLVNNSEDMNTKVTKELEILKQKVIIAIIGDVDKGIVGMNGTFDITDKNTGAEITNDLLQEYSYKDLEDSFKDILDALEAEI